MKINLVNNRFIFSLYTNLFSVEKPDKNIDVNVLYEIIKFGYLKKQIKLLRSVKTKAEYNRIKRENLPCVTLSGKFLHRDSKGLIKHSGLMQIDIDDVADYDSIFQELCLDNYTYLCFRSPGGKGIKIVVKINPSADTHKGQFLALEAYYKEQFALIIDSSCKDIARSMLLSYDPNIYCNPRSDVFEEIQEPKIKQKVQDRKSKSHFINQGSNSEDVSELIENITRVLEQRKIDITDTYDKWIRVGYSLCSSLGENGRSYFHRIGSMYPNYTKEESDNKYSYLLGKNDGRIKIGTLIYYAKEVGVEV